MRARKCVPGDDLAPPLLRGERWQAKAEGGALTEHVVIGPTESINMDDRAAIRKMKRWLEEKAQEANRLWLNERNGGGYDFYYGTEWAYRQAARQAQALIYRLERRRNRAEQEDSA